MGNKIDRLRKALVKGEESGVADYDLKSLLYELDRDSATNKPKYTLNKLLKKCDFEATSNKELMEWERITPLGREINDQE